ncbi:MAG: helix-turn-helix transcriptional regulator [Lachnospiraceae bacterium]|nr:helix-turn-helix transcriptional regulator [Lachnospiraceae bacterium]
MFGDIIKKLGIAHNLNQVQLAGKLNISKQTVSNWENNNILPSIEMLVKIARFFMVSIDYLLELDQREYLEITSLTDEQTAHFKEIIRLICIYQMFFPGIMPPYLIRHSSRTAMA